MYTIKQWLAQLVKERLDEILCFEIVIERAINNYRKKGYMNSGLLKS